MVHSIQEYNFKFERKLQKLKDWTVLLPETPEIGLRAWLRYIDPLPVSRPRGEGRGEPRPQVEGLSVVGNCILPVLHNILKISIFPPISELLF